MLLMSCVSEEKKPRGLIPEDQMAGILVDVHIFEAEAEKKKFSKDSMIYYVHKNYELIYEKHGVSKEKFEKTFSYYEDNPGQMDDLYQKVVDNLSKMEAELTGEPIQREEEE